MNFDLIRKTEMVFFKAVSVCFLELSQNLFGVFVLCFAELANNEVPPILTIVF